VSWAGRAKALEKRCVAQRLVLPPAVPISVAALSAQPPQQHSHLLRALRSSPLCSPRPKRDAAGTPHDPRGTEGWLNRNGGGDAGPSDGSATSFPVPWRFQKLDSMTVLGGLPHTCFAHVAPSSSTRSDRARFCRVDHQALSTAPCSLAFWAAGRSVTPAEKRKRKPGAAAASGLSCIGAFIFYKRARAAAFRAGDLHGMRPGRPALPRGTGGGSHPS